METSMKGNSSLAKLCFQNTTASHHVDPHHSTSANTSPGTSPSLRPTTTTSNNSTSTSPQTATTTKTNNNNNSGSSPQTAITSAQTAASLSSSLTKLSGLFPGPNCKCLVASHVAPFLDERSLISLMRTCKRLREITASDEVWETRLRDMKVNLILINRASNFFRAFRSDIITLRGLEGFYDFESEETGANAFNSFGNEFSSAPVTAIKKVMLTISPAFLGFVTPVARVCLVVQYFGLAQEDVFEGTVRYSFPKRLFVMSTYLTRAPRQDGPKFDIVIARSARKWGTQKPSHFDKVKGGTRLILSISNSSSNGGGGNGAGGNGAGQQQQQQQNPTANGYLPSTELLTVSRIPRDGEGPVPPLPDSAVSGVGAGGNPVLSGNSVGGLNSNNGAGGNKTDSTLSNSSTGSLRELDTKESSPGNSSSNNSSASSSKNSSPASSEKRFSLRNLLGGMKSS